MTRKREITASPEAVYDLVADPRRQAGWWPRVTRIEDVTGRPGAERTRWTAVLAAESGRLLRVDYRCIGANRPGFYRWEQELEGTVFERHLNGLTLTLQVKESGVGEAAASLTVEHRMKGMARLAGLVMRNGQKRLLDEALAGLAELLEPAPTKTSEGESTDATTP